MKDNFVNRPLSKKLNRQNIVSRIENLEGKTAIKPSSAMLVEDLSEITDEVNAAIIRAIDVNAGVVRMIMSGEDIYDGDVYNIHANLAGFNDAGEPTVWIDAQDGKLYGGEGNVGMDESGLWLMVSETYGPTSSIKYKDANNPETVYATAGANLFDGVLHYYEQWNVPEDAEGILEYVIQSYNDSSAVAFLFGTQIGETYGPKLSLVITHAGGYVAIQNRGLCIGIIPADVPDGDLVVAGDITASSATAGDGNFFGATPASLADDSAMSFSPKKLYGILCLNMRTSATGESGIFAYRCSGSGARMEIIAAGSHIETTTGVLSGMSGTDGKLTLSAHTDGNIYIENRRGAGRSFTYTLLGA